MSMPIKPEELRQLRAWAAELVIGKYATEMAHGQRVMMPETKKIISEARSLVSFIRSSTGT
jgi:hypothetical protein